MQSSLLLVAAGCLLAAFLSYPAPASAFNVPAVPVFRLLRRSFELGPSVDLARVEPIVAAAEKAKSREGDEMNVKRTFNEQQPMMMMHSMSMHENLGRLLLKREEAMMSDPRFVNCMGDVSGPEDPRFVNVFAKCYSFAGRPRFGKRGWRPQYNGHDFGNNF